MSCCPSEGPAGGPADGPPTLVVDLGGSTLRAGLVHASDQVGHQVSDRVGVLLPPAPQDRLEMLLTSLEGFAGRVGRVGVAVAGTVRGGELVWSANLGLQHVPLAALIEARVGAPVTLLNDARAAGLAEARVGAAAGYDVVLALTVGTGIGGAVISGGRLLQGTGDAGEVGHLRLDREGPLCGCGRHGCWETRVGGKALARQAGELLDLPGSEALASLEVLAAAGDPRATGFLRDVAEDFARGVDALCAVLAPHAVVLGGGVMARRGAVARAYRGILRELRWADGAVVVDSRLGDDAGLLGAGLHAAATLDRHLDAQTNAP